MTSMTLSPSSERGVGSRVAFISPPPSAARIAFRGAAGITENRDGPSAPSPMRARAPIGDYGEPERVPVHALE